MQIELYLLALLDYLEGIQSLLEYPYQKMTRALMSFLCSMPLVLLFFLLKCLWLTDRIFDR